MDLREKFRQLVDEHASSRHEESLAAFKHEKEARAEALEGFLTPLELSTYYAGMAAVKYHQLKDQSERLKKLKSQFKGKVSAELLGQLSDHLGEGNEENESMAEQAVAVAMGMHSAECMVMTLKDGSHASIDEDRARRLTAALVSGDCDCENCQMRVKAFSAAMSDPEGAFKKSFADGWKKNMGDIFKGGRDE